MNMALIASPSLQEFLEQLLTFSAAEYGSIAQVLS